MIETVITSSVLILIIIILRTVFKGRIKNTVRYALWLIAAVRLVLPFSLIESSVSIMNLINGFSIAVEQQEDNKYTPAAADEFFSDHEQGQTYIPYEPPADSFNYDTYTELPSIGYGSTMYYKDAQTTSDNKVSPEKEPLSLKTTATVIWIIGASVMLLWFGAVNCIFYAGLRRTRKEFRYDAPLKIYSVQGINSPCIFGFPKPAIYLPEKAACENESIRFVVTHELCHYYHGDMIWASLRYILLALYWFNPLVWAAAILSKRDCECACDEAAIHRIGEDRRFEHGKAVIDLIPQRRVEMFGIVSTSMASSKNVLKERMTMIAAKPKNRLFALVFSVLAVILATCGTFTSAVNIEDVYTDEDISADPEETHGEADILSSGSESALNINVTDYTGAGRTLYYISPPDNSMEAFVYMTDASGGWENVPAKSGEAYSGNSMREFFTRSRFSKADIITDGETKTLTLSKSSADFNALSDALCSIDPEYCSEAISGEPFSEIKFSRENGGFSSSLTVRFYRAGNRIAGRITAEDYSEIVSLITSENQPPLSEKLNEAYNSSVCTVSEFFYAEDTELYKITDVLLNGDIFSEPEIMKYESFQADLFSSELAKRFGATGEIPDRYIMTQTGNVLLGVPYDGSLNTIDSLLLWQTKDMSLRITQNGIKTPTVGAYSETGSFCGQDCIYYEDGSKNEIGLIFSDYDGNIYTAYFEYKWSDGIDTGHKIFGSIHLAEKPAAVPYVPAVALSSQPSIYGDENYDIADTDRLYTGTFRANAPAMLVTGFRITNGVTDYETNFECYIEKYEPDGNWYRVIPIADIVQVNTGFGHFYTKEEEGRIPCCIDLSCYPLLPMGKYRLVKPFRLKGSDHDDYAALFDFYMTDKIEPQGELLCTAECKDKEISADAKTITYEITSNKVGFALSEIVDVERETPNGWKSVRTGIIRTNSLHASFPLGFAGTYQLDASDYDISVPGNYRIRLSYGNVGGELNVPRDGYDTAYAYFKVY